MKWDNLKSYGELRSRTQNKYSFIVTLEKGNQLIFDNPTTYPASKYFDNLPKTKAIKKSE